MNELKPGRELDVLIAERVMGWEPREENPVKWRNPDTSDGYRTDDDLPGFSTDIAAAWGVWGRLTTMKYKANLTLVRLADNKYVVTALMGGAGTDIYSTDKKPWHEDGYLDEDTVGDTAPHAICLAAMRAYDEKFRN